MWNLSIPRWLLCSAWESEANPSAKVRLAITGLEINDPVKQTSFATCACFRAVWGKTGGKAVDLDSALPLQVCVKCMCVCGTYTHSFSFAR